MINLDHLSKEELALALYLATAHLNEIKMRFVKPSQELGGVHKSQEDLLLDLFVAVKTLEYKEMCLEIFRFGVVD